MTILDPVDVECPPDVVDRLMWRMALQILQRHTVRSDGQCQWCDWRSPCSAQRLAERADMVARLPWYQAQAERNDITRLLPVVRAQRAAPVAVGSVALGSVALGSVALGSVAVGSVAVGARGVATVRRSRNQRRFERPSRVRLAAFHGRAAAAGRRRRWPTSPLVA